MKVTYKKALSIANDFIKRFVVNEYAIAGSLRRKEAMIGDVDIITAAPLSTIEKAFSTCKSVEKVRGGEKKLDVDYRGMRFNIYFAMPFYWGSMLFFLTGPARYAIAYRKKAKAKGWHLDQYGLKNERGEVIASRSETSIYKAFDKSYKQPELRGK